MNGEVRERVRVVLAEIESSCRAAGRRSEDVRLVAVSKTMSCEIIQAVYDAGLRCFGENKVQEYLDKKDILPSDIAWHFIGRLQTNKVKFLMQAASRGQLALLESLDRVELAQEIEKQAAKAGVRKVPCLIQVNSSGEDTKAGFELDEVAGFVGALKQDSVLEIRGLMTIGPNTEDQAAIRSSFRAVSRLRDQLKVQHPAYGWEILSMGMSADYRIAIAEGSTSVRVGTAIFGKRS